MQYLKVNLHFLWVIKWYSYILFIKTLFIMDNVYVKNIWAESIKDLLVLTDMEKIKWVFRRFMSLDSYCVKWWLKIEDLVKWIREFTFLNSQNRMIESSFNTLEQQPFSWEDAGNRVKMLPWRRRNMTLQCTLYVNDRLSADLTHAGWRWG